MFTTALLVVLSLRAIDPVHAGAPAPWDSASEADASGRVIRRFIPPELYAGAAWDGNRELVIRPMNVVHKPIVPRDHPPISIVAPVPWEADPSVVALKRIRVSGRSGAVVQMFAVNERGDGLGRLSDHRGARVRDNMAECFKFPLGIWQQGETRTCRDSTIRIIEIDFSYAGFAHSLMFRWNNEGTYVFSPERGMVSVTH